MFPLAPIISLLLSLVKLTSQQGCRIIGPGQDTFGLYAQTTGNFVPPVPQNPGAPSRGRPNNPWMLFPRSGVENSGFFPPSPSQQTPTSNQPTLSQMLSFFPPARSRRDIDAGSAGTEKPLSRVRRIVGGYDALQNQLCWQVKVQLGNFFDETICGGSIIGSRTILMAAHCLYDEDTRRRIPDRRISVIAGGMNRDVGEPYGTDLTGCAEKYVVERSIVHPDYNYDLNDNDIAILILTTRIQLDSKPCVCTLCLSSRIPQPAEWCVVSGFGEESNNGRTDRNPVPLKWTQLQVRANDYSGQCAFNTLRSGGLLGLRPVRRTNLDLFLCAGTQLFEDTCQGDSGGPLVCLDPTRRMYYQAGIVSFGDDCGTGVGGQYTKVSQYIPWIVASTVSGDVAANV